MTTQTDKPGDEPGLEGSLNAEEKPSALEQPSETNSVDKPDENDYPSGTKLFFIILGIILSIFLASLDMVRWIYSPSLPQPFS